MWFHSISIRQWDSGFFPSHFSGLSSWSDSFWGISISFWYLGRKSLVLVLSVFNVVHLVPWCPKVVSARYGWENTRVWILALFFLPPPRLLSALQVLVLYLVLYHIYLFLWRNMPQLFDLIFMAEGLQMKEANFFPISKIQFYISNYYSLYIFLLNEKCKTLSYSWSSSHGK